MKAIFIPSQNGLQVHGGITGDLHEVDPKSYAGERPVLIGASLEAIANAQAITDSPRGAALKNRVPQTLTPRQVRLQLLADKHPASEIEAAIAAIPENVTTNDGLSLKEAAMITWDYALTYERRDPLLLQLAACLGYDTKEKLDNFFISASSR